MVDSEDQEEAGVYHVTIRQYAFDTENWIFPMDGLDNTLHKQFADNVGFISAGYLQFVNLFPENIDAESNVYFSVRDENMSMTSVSGRNILEQANTGDDMSGLAVTLYPKGKINTRHLINNGTLAFPWDNGDSAAFAGQTVTLDYDLRYDGDGYIRHLHQLCKYDPEGMDIVSASAVPADEKSGRDSLSILYAAKPDGSAWQDNEEMKNATEENLVFYGSLEKLEASGKICVGILTEADGIFYADSDYVLYHSGIRVRLKTDAEAINRVFMICSGIRAWRDTDAADSADWEAVPCREDSGAYGLGDAAYSAGKYYGGMKGTYNIQHTGYQPTEYDGAGNILGGHTGSTEKGNSILIVQYKAYVSKTIEDRTAEGEVKKSYSLDANERLITYGLKAGTTVPDWSEPNYKTDLIITDRLPRSLSYQEGSALWGNRRITPEITVSPDGGSCLVFDLPDVDVGKDCEKITFTCKIGSPGTQEDVKNNDIIENTAVISGTGDHRVANAAGGNLSSVSFACIKLSSNALSKSTETPYVAIGAEFSYDIRFSNMSANALRNAILYDPLPFNGDGRNTDFGGTYQLKSVTLNFDGAPKSFADYRAGNYSAMSSDDAETKTTDFARLQAFSGWKKIPGRKDDVEKKTITLTQMEENTNAVRLMLSLSANEYVDIHFVLLGQGGQHEGDVYVNNAYEYIEGQSHPVVSNRASVQLYGSVPVTKEWDDEDNAFDTRPESIRIQLLQNGKPFGKAAVLGKNETEYIFRNVPLYDAEGNACTYAVKEENAGKLYTSLTAANAGGDSASGRDVSRGFTITNRIQFKKLTLEKRATGTLANKDRKFKFSLLLRCGGVPYAEKKLLLSGSQKTKAKTGEDGVVRLELSDGDQVTVAGIPEGAEYSVTEAHSGYKQVISGDSPEGILDADKAVQYENIREGAEVSKTVDRQSNDIGQVHTWTIEGTIPKDISGAPEDKFYYEIEDVLDARLAYQGIAEADGVYLRCEDDKKTALAENADFQADLSGRTLTFRLLTEGLRKAASAVKDGETAKLVISFRTSIAEAAAGAHIPNSVTLHYGGYGDAGEMEVARPDAKNPDDPYVYTGDIKAVKISSGTGKNISGCTFLLAEKTGGGRLEALRRDDSGKVLHPGEDGYSEAKDWIVVSGADGSAVFHGLAAGKYYLQETQAAPGYSLLAEPFDVTLKADQAYAAVTVRDDGTMVLDAGGSGTSKYYILMAVFGICTLAGYIFRRIKETRSLRKSA